MDHFARSLSSVRVLDHEDCAEKTTFNPPLPSLAIIYPKLQRPVALQRSGDPQWVTVADVVESI